MIDCFKKHAAPSGLGRSLMVFSTNTASRWDFEENRSCVKCIDKTKLLPVKFGSRGAKCQ